MIELKVGTRKSALALNQTDKVIKKLSAIGISCRIVEITTRGDTTGDMPIRNISGSGIFVSEIERQLRRKEIDIAVHSLKDLTDINNNDLVISAILQRENPSDAFISRDYPSLESLPPGAVVGTSSVRRISQLKAFRSDLNIKDIRGNVDTRLKKLYCGDYSALIMAAAGLIRLGLKDKIKQIMDIDDFTPVRGQGIIVVQTRKEDRELNKIIEKIDDIDTRNCFEIELAFTRVINGGCLTPVGVCCLKKGDLYTLYAYIGDISGRNIKRKIEKKNMTTDDAMFLANQMKKEGRDIIERIKNK
jgi:hydroxymethylbilane synthase